MDLFEEEQQIYDHAVTHMKSVESGEPYDFEEYKKLVKEYRAILKQLRWMTKISDKTAEGLHESNLSLVDKIHYDTLTGIYNRRYMESCLEHSIRSLSLSGGTLSVLMMDIDFFKNYNDTYGHSAGDDCLKAVAKTLESCASRPEDFVARYGGEEFVAILPNTDQESSRLMAERILNAVSGLAIPHEKSETADCVTISIGGTTLKPEITHQFMDYIKRADTALYISKQNGRNRYTYIKYEEDFK